MAAVNAAPPGGNSGNGRRLPEWLDPNSNHGQLVVMSMVAKDGGKFPDNPFVIGRSLEHAAGGKLDETYTENRGSRYVLKVRSEAKVQKLLQMTELIDGTKVAIQLHPTMNFVKCVVSCPEAINMSKELLETELSSQGVTNVHRITRQDGKVRVNTPTLILTISGTVIPKHIWFGSLRVPTRVYYPSPMVCYKCFAYGHTKLRCQGQERCRNCSKSHPIDLEAGCASPPQCLHCGEGHQSNSRKCKVFQKEEEIIRIKVNTGVSFIDAKKEYDRVHGEKSYAGVSGAQIRLHQDEKDREIQVLRAEVERMKGVDQELAKLRKIVEELSTKKHKRSKKERTIQVMKVTDSEMEAEEIDKKDKLAKRKQQGGSGEISPPYKRNTNGNDSELMSGSNYESTGAIGGEVSSPLPQRSRYGPTKPQSSRM